MPVEIRELVIKTEIRTRSNPGSILESDEIKQLKQQIILECQRILASRQRKRGIGR